VGGSESSPAQQQQQQQLAEMPAPPCILSDKVKSCADTSAVVHMTACQRPIKCVWGMLGGTVDNW
jgi:hypothetical protein